MSTKELVVELRIPLPEGMFESASVITKAQTVTEAFRASVETEIGSDYTLKVDTVRKLSPRAANATNGADKPARRPRTPAAAAPDAGQAAPQA